MSCELTFFWMKRPIRRMATAPTMAKTRMTPGSRAAQFFRFMSVWRAASLRATRDMSIAAIAAVVDVCVNISSGDSEAFIQSVQSALMSWNCVEKLGSWVYMNRDWHKACRDAATWVTTYRAPMGLKSRILHTFTTKIESLKKLTGLRLD
jgi:hypothetical protein